jgi:hypothetical protein
VEIGLKPDGYFIIEQRNAKRTVRREFQNEILNIGWTAMLAKPPIADSAMVPKYLFFGIGETPATKDDLGLEQRITPGKLFTSASYSGLTNAGNLTAYSQVFVRFDYAPGELSGVRWTEVGLAYGEEYEEPFNRAIISDEARVPVPLVVLPDDAVTVYVRLRLFLNGWGETAFIGDLYEGVKTMSPNISSSTVGLWIRGLPLVEAVMGGQTATRVQDHPPKTIFRWNLGPLNSPFEASTLSLRGRGGTEFLRIDFDAVKRPQAPVDWIYKLDLGVTIVRFD